MSFYLSPTIACLVCHRLNTSPVHLPVVSPLASHLPGLPWEETVSFYLSPTIACLVCHRLNTSPVYIPKVYLPWSLLSPAMPPTSQACHGRRLCPSTSPLPWEDTVSFYLSPTIACLVCHRLNTSPVYIPVVSPLASHLPGLPWEETVSFYLSPTIACLVCHRLNTSPVHIPVVSPLASHLPGLPWEETVSFYLSPTIACHGRRLCPSTSPLP